MSNHDLTNQMRLLVSAGLSDFVSTQEDSHELPLISTTSPPWPHSVHIFWILTITAPSRSFRVRFLNSRQTPVTTPGPQGCVPSQGHVREGWSAK